MLIQRIFTIFFSCILGFFSGYSQTTIEKNGKEFFNGDDRHLRVYLNNNYDRLDPIEGIWIFTRIEYNTWGVEVSRTPNEITAAIVRDPDNLRRAYVEVNMSRAFCKDYQITYSIQTGGGSGYYPCEPEGCGVMSGQYYFDYQQKTLSRPAISLMGNRAVLVGIKTFPQGPPAGMLPEVGGATPVADGQVTKRQPHIITHPSGWEPHIDWDNQIFSSYILSMSTANPKNFQGIEDYLGDPVSVLGIVIKNPRPNSDVQIEIAPTTYSKGTKQTFRMEKRGTQYAIFPKVSWEYELLRCLEQAVPLDFTFKVSINGKEPVEQVVTANLRAIDDCPLAGYDYRGELIDLKFMAAAYVNEGSPLVKDLMSEIRDKGLLREFVGLQHGPEVTIQQVYSFWKLLRERGISYSSITNNGQESEMVWSQRIRLLEDVISETQANCVDGTALFASCLQTVSIPPIMIFVPSHAFLGFVLDYIPNQDSKKDEPVVVYLETTKLGETIPDHFPDGFAELVKIEPYNTMKQALDKKFGSGRNAQKEINYFILSMMYGQMKFIESMKKNHEVTSVSIDLSRKIIKPIYRCKRNTGNQLHDPKPPRNEGFSNTQQETKSAATVYSNRIKPTEPTSNVFEKTRRKGTESYDLFEFQTDAPDTEKDVFRVQIETCAVFDANKGEYRQLAEFGKLYSEYLTEKNRYRIMLGDFPSKVAAQKSAKKAQSLGFDYVAIVRYQKGNRYESIYRDWKLLPD